MSKYNFNKDLAFGQQYEVKFSKWLASKGVCDVELNDSVTQGFKQEGGYDVRTPFDTYEIKYDRWMEQTGNICIETYSCVRFDDDGVLMTRTDGWFLTICADWLIVFFNEHEFIGMPVKHLRGVWLSNPRIWRRVEIEQVSNARLLLTKGERSSTEKGDYKTVNWLARCSPDNFPEMIMGDIRK